MCIVKTLNEVRPCIMRNLHRPYSTLPLLFCCIVGCLGDTSAPKRTSFRGLYSSELLDAQEVIPKKVSHKAEFLSSDLNSFHSDNTTHFNITINDEEHFLILNNARGFISPGIIVQRHRRDVHVRYKPKPESTRCHFHGVVHGKPYSKVAISACNGLTGLIHTDKGKFWIEPSHHPNKTVTPGHKHLIFKRSAIISNHHKRKKKRKKRRLAKNCGTKEPRRMTELEWHKELGKIKVQEKIHKHKQKVSIAAIPQYELKKHKYKRVNKRIRRSISKPQYVETLLVADPVAAEFHEDGDIETYLLTIMNMVSSLYMDPSIGNYVQVVVVKIILIDDPSSEPHLAITSNADSTLKNFCRWQKALNPGNDSHPHHHDVAILITRKDICAKQNAPCNTLGVAHVGGMCNSNRSCSVNEDNGITLAHTIAHEMGHNFGMYHDTEKIGCKSKVGSTLHIMTPSFEADTVGVRWSRCSRRDITNFLDQGLGNCLQDEPDAIADYEYPELPPGAMYNADYQCRLQFGGEAQVCSPPDEICSRLWCNVNDTCTTQLRPAAPGTRCGKHMWCQEQKCVPIMEPPVAIDGGWGEWSSWSECSRTCGAGVSIMERECDHPRPAAGGRFCVGERRRYRMCNIDPCPEDQPTFRAVQCSSYNNHTYEGKTYTWVPYFDKEEPCELYCSDINDTVIVPWGEHASDGTPCHVGSRDVCIAGMCRKVGCDWVVDSSAEEDDCGICQGDGTKCDKIQGVYTKQSPGAGYREMIAIPADSRNIRIEEMGNSENYIGIGSAVSKKFYLNGKRQITLPGEYTVAGVQALYERDNEREKIHIPGPTRETIIVYVIFRGKIHNPGVSYKFTRSKREAPKTLKYEWVLSDWSQCSATCGGGIQHREPQCLESTIGTVASVVDGTSTIVDEAMCDPDEQPDQVRRDCNVDACPSYWYYGPWQSCPVTCAAKGSKPQRRRSVMCVNVQQMALPDSFCDGNTRPDDHEACVSLPLCVEE